MIDIVQKTFQKGASLMQNFQTVALVILSIGIVATLAFAGGNADNGKKLFSDPALAGSTNDRSCNTCHENGSGLEATAKNFENSGKSLEDMINACVSRPLGGKPLAKDSQEMQDIVSYIQSLGGK